MGDLGRARASSPDNPGADEDLARGALDADVRVAGDRDLVGRLVEHHLDDVQDVYTTAVLD